MVSATIKRIVKDNAPLLNILKKVQDTEGCLSEETLRYISQELKIPLAKLYEASSFYSFFRFESKGKHSIRICNSPSCYLNGSREMIKIVEKLTGLKPGEHNEKFSFELTSCIGCCDAPPAMMLNDKVFTELNKNKLRKILKQFE